MDTKMDTTNQDKLIRDIFTLYEKHGEAGLPKARMLLAKYSYQEAVAFRDIMDCDTRLAVAGELTDMADGYSDDEYAATLEIAAAKLREDVKARGVIARECNPDESNI